MYEEYMQNFLNYPLEGYQNTYDYPYNYHNQDMYRYSYNQTIPIQNRNIMEFNDIEEQYPQIYKIIYPMVKKVCSQNNRPISSEMVNQMVEEVYSNIEESNGTELNITLKNETRGEKLEEKKSENRQIGRNNLLNDLIRILILRELTARPGCFGPNCRPNPRPRPPKPYPWQM